VNTDTTIVLTSDSDLLAKLERKLEEYERRIAFRAPESDPHATYKRDILKHLVEFGTADLDSMMQAARNVSWFHEMAFRDAFQIVRAYNANAMQNLFGGTGLN